MGVLGQDVIDLINVVGVGAAALLLFLWTVIYQSRIQANTHKHREKVETEGRALINKIAQDQMERATKLEDTLREREELISAKKVEILGLEKQLEVKTLYYDDSQRRLEVTEASLLREKSKVEGLNAVVAKLSQKLEAVEKQVARLEADLTDERQKRGDIEHDMKSVQSALNVAQGLKIEVEKINTSLKAENAVLRTENESLRRDLEQVRAEKKALEARLADVEAKLDKIVSQQVEEQAV